ncbi:099102cc-d898-40f2-9f57-975a3729d281 [Thermothielavioides terrestris]|uniref:099102cc-d898-40f2-9f57-975a3729d281 n=1 Tax=Thermothielavioides terrestris TaxID=2587410 RepID=A0A446BE71_9PEZI|nr:099102cc-d898-40f2-9f57-975a3729d281 [Thermothielavioides terrestris]
MLVAVVALRGRGVDRYLSDDNNEDYN